MTPTLVDVTTPDGRIVKLPAGIASSFQGLTPVPLPAPAPPIVAAPQVEPAQDHGPALESPAPDPAVGFAAPPALPSQAPDPQVQIAPQQAPQPEQPLPLPPVTAPQALPISPPTLTAAQAAQVGAADVYNAEQAVAAQREVAVEAQARADANEAVAVAQALEERNARADQILAEQEKRAKEFEAKHQARMIDYEAQAAKIRETRIDRSADQPLLAVLGVVLGQVGAAMAGQTQNPALSMLMESIDRKVAAQMQDMDIARKNLAGLETSIAAAGASSKDVLATYDVRRMAEIERTKAKVEAIAKRAESPRIAANAVATIAKLDEERAKSLASLADRERARLKDEQDREDQMKRHRQSIGVQYAQMAQSRALSDRSFLEEKRQFDLRRSDDISAAVAKANAEQRAAISEAVKANEERGIRDPAAGTWLFQPKGAAIMSKAETLDAQALAEMKAANKEADQAKREPMIAAAQAKMQAASSLRMDAEQFAVRAGNTGERTAIANVIGGTQTAVSVIDEIIDLRRKYGPNWVSETANDQAMKTKMGLLSLQVKEAFTLGALDKGSSEYLDRITGGDPTKVGIGDVTGMLNSARGNEASLKALADSLERNARGKLSSVMEGADRLKFRRAKHGPPTAEEAAGIELLREKTPLERAKGEERTGALGKAADFVSDTVLTPFSSGSVQDRRMKAVSETGDEHGLSNQQGAIATTLVKGYLKGGAKGQQAANVLIGAATDATRPEFALSMLRKLEAEAPDLAAQAMERMPDPLRDALGARKQAAESVIRQLPGTLGSAR